MPITVGDVTYVCGKKAKDPINVQCPTRGTWQIFKRHVNETDSQMQRRIGERFAKDIVAEMEAAAASRSVEPASTTPTSSKASVGSKHKPSPPKEVPDMPPPPPKKPSTRSNLEPATHEEEARDEKGFARLVAPLQGAPPPPHGRLAPSALTRLRVDACEGPSTH